MSLRWLISFVAVAVLGTACFGGGGEGTPGTADEPSPPVSGSHPDYLRWPGGDPVTLDPHLVTDVGSHGYVGNIFGGLMRLDPLVLDKNGKVVAAGYEATRNEDIVEKVRTGVYTVTGIAVPDLAKDFPEKTVNTDGTVSYTFTIRDNAKFSNGRTVTAWDFGYSLDRAADPRTRSSTTELYLGDIVGVMDMWRYGKIQNRICTRVSSECPDGINSYLVDLPGVKVLDEKTLVITIDADKSYFLQKLTYPTAAVVDKTQVEAVGNWTDRPNGTGPYRLTRRTISEIVLEANPYYHEKAPAIKRIVFTLTGASSYLRYQNGEVDAAGIGIADPEVLEEVRNSSSKLSKEYFSTNEMGTSYVGLNLTRPPFDDVRVRQAFAMSVDKQVIAERVLMNLVSPAYTVLPPGMPGYRAGHGGLPYDPDRARELLRESAYGGPAGLGRIKLTVSGTGSAPSVTIEALVEMWRQNLGLEVEIEQIDYPTFLDRIRKGEFQMFSLGWIADYPDPEDFLDLKLHGERSRANNETGYNNPEVNRLLEKARTEQNLEKRTLLYHEAEDRIIEEVPWLLLFHLKSSLVIKPYVKGYFPTPLGIPMFRFMYFEN